MADGDISSEGEAASLAGIKAGHEPMLRAMEALDSAAEALEALTPMDRESVSYTLHEEADMLRQSKPKVADAFEALERIVRASGLVAGRCRICGCTEASACSIVTPGSDAGAAMPGLYGQRSCGWADDEETLCDAPNCLARAAEADRQKTAVQQAVDEVLGQAGPGPFKPSSGITRGGRAESMPVEHTEDGGR